MPFNTLSRAFAGQPLPSVKSASQHCVDGCASEQSPSLVMGWTLVAGQFTFTHGRTRSLLTAREAVRPARPADKASSAQPVNLSRAGWPPPDQCGSRRPAVCSESPNAEVSHEAGGKEPQ